EVLVNPYATTASDGAAFRYMYKQLPDLRQFARRDLAPSRNRVNANSTMGNDAFHLIGALASMPFTGMAAGLAVSSLFKGQVKHDEGTVLTHGGTFDSTKIAGNSVSTELGFAVIDVPKAMEIIIDEMCRGDFLGIAALRYVKGSRAYLAFTQFDPSCAIEILGIRTRASIDTYERIWRRLRDKLLYTFHWGQFLKWG